MLGGLEDYLGHAHVDRCMKRLYGWRDRELSFYNHREILVKNFGLRIWSEAFRFTPDHKGADYLAYKITIAYFLTLPYSTVSRSEWNISEPVSSNRW